MKKRKIGEVEELATRKERVELTQAVTKIARKRLVSRENTTEEREKPSLVREMRRRFEKVEEKEKQEKDKKMSKVGEMVKKLEGATSQSINCMSRKYEGGTVKSGKIYPASTLDKQNSQGEKLKLPETKTLKPGNDKRVKNEISNGLTNNLKFRSQFDVNRSVENVGGSLAINGCEQVAVPSTRRPNVAGLRDKDDIGDEMTIC